MVPVTAYATQNRPVNKMANPKRSAGARPISIMSLANPIVLKVKKTPTREIMTVFRGTVPHTDLVIFIGYRRFGESYYSSGLLRGEQVLVRERLRESQPICNVTDSSNALIPFHAICTPIQTKKKDDNCVITVIPVAPKMRANRSAN